MHNGHFRSIGTWFLNSLRTFQFGATHVEIFFEYDPNQVATVDICKCLSNGIQVLASCKYDPWRKTTKRAKGVNPHPPSANSRNAIFQKLANGTNVACREN